MDEMDAIINELITPLNTPAGSKTSSVNKESAKKASTPVINVASTPTFTQTQQQYQAQQPQSQQVRSALETCPPWILKKLRDEMFKRHEIEQKWVATVKKVEQFEQDLIEWKANASKLLEDQKARDLEIAKKDNEELKLLKEALKQKEDELKHKEKELKEKSESLKSRENQIRLLTEQVEIIKSSGAVGSEKLVLPTQIVEEKDTSEASFVQFTLPYKRSDEESLEGAVPFSGKRAGWLDTSAKSEAVLELLFKPDLAVISAICDSATGKIQDEVVKVLLNLADARGETMRLFDFMIQKEVLKTKSEATLFRGNSPVSKMMTLFTKLVGLPWLSDMLKPLIQEIVEKNEPLELDPNKTSPGEDPEANLKKVRQISQKFLDTILSSMDTCPLQFREICSQLYAGISKKFPEDPFNGVKNFIFLRFVCPAILAPPKEFGFEDVRDNARRTLVLISKILQNLVNGAEFKEPYMKGMNTFVNDNLDRMKKTLQQLGEVPSAKNFKLATVPKGPPIKESLRSLINCMSEMKDSLLDKLHAFDSQIYTQTITFKTSERLISVCVEIGMPKKGKKTVLVPNDSKVDDLLMLLVEEEKLVSETADLANQDKDSKILSALVYILTTAEPSKTVSLIKSCISREVQQPLDTLVSDSMTSRTFGSFCQLICGTYLKELLTPFIEELNESKDELKPNSDKLMEITQKILANALKSLNSTCPQVIWEVCNHFYQESKNAKVKLPTERVVALLFLVLFVPAIDTPENYIGVQDLPKKKVRKSLALCSEVLRYIATNADEGVKDPRMLQFIKKRYEITCQLVEDWLLRPAESKPAAPITPSWGILEDYLRATHSFLCDKMSAINFKLGSTGTSKKVSFKLYDFCDALLAGPSKSDATKSAVF